MKIRCTTCGKYFEGMDGKEDTCPKDLKIIMNKGDINNADHSYRQTAIAIIEQIIEPSFKPKGINGKLYYELEDKIVNIINKYI